MYKALVIGCGNIGAQYDINNDEIQTHVKAFYLNPHTEVSVFDINYELAKNVAEKYSCKITSNILPATLAKYDIVSICTPTLTHFQLLVDAINAKVKIIICEKPVSQDIAEMDKLKEVYLNGESKILVNYIRRFQPEFFGLKSYVQNHLSKEELTNVSIRYQRGFINNCSHAMDLIEFLLNTEILLDQIKIHNVVYDQFDNDATLSLQALWNKTNVNIIGLSNVMFSYFEIELFFKMYQISILSAGNIIKVYKSPSLAMALPSLILQEGLSKKDCLKHYMRHVINEALKLIENPNTEDNFLTSIRLNQKMLTYNN